MDTIFNTEGCFYRALDDEPVFVILARDPVAPEVVRHWVLLRQALIGSGEKPLEDHDRLVEASATAGAMTAWRSDATDPSVYGPGGKRWHVEKPPERRLVAHPTAVTHGYALADDAWREWKAAAMPLGNRFLLGMHHGVLSFAENLRRGEDAGESWSGLYPVNRSLQSDMLQAAYDDWTAQRHHKVETIKQLLATPPQEEPEVYIPDRAEPVILAVIRRNAPTIRTILEGRDLAKGLHLEPDQRIDLGNGQQP